MDSTTTSEHSNDKELEKPPTLTLAESAGEKVSGGCDQPIITMASVGDEKTAKMPVLQPNVSIVGTRTKSGRIHKPARNFNSDEYVVPALVKRRIPNNSRAHIFRAQAQAGAAASSAASEMDPQIRSRLEERFAKASSQVEESPFNFIISMCLKDFDNSQSISVSDIHTKVREMHKSWTKGPYKLRDDETKFLQECIVKPEWSRISMKEWRILAESLKDRSNRMRKRFSRGGRMSKANKRKEEIKKCFVDLGSKIVGSQDGNSDEELDTEEYFDDTGMEEDIGDIDNSSSHSSRLSVRRSNQRSSKTPSLANDESKDVDFELSLSSVGIDDITSEDLKDEMFDDLESSLVNESKNSKVENSNSMVAALHATLQKDGGPQFDPSQYEPPELEKDSTMFALEDMEDVENSCNFFENLEEPSFGNAETPTGLSDEAFAELEQRVADDLDENMDLGEDESIDKDQQPSTSARSNVAIKGGDKLDLSAVEIEESSGTVKVSANVDLANPGVTMISTKTALMCALKISEDFLPSSHEKYLDRLEITEKYRHDDIDDIRKKFNMKPSALATKRKLTLNTDPKTKVALKVINNGGDKPKPHPYLRSAYAKCRKFMEDETTVIEKLGNKKIMAAGRVIEIDYENYLKEADVEIPYDELGGQMPTLPPPTVSNCHAPSCRLGCICSSISEDMPPRKHCGRPKCFFECNCQQILFNSNDDGDIRSRLRPRVSLLNWRAESTEKEKEPMTSYRQMERGTHFIRVRRTTVQPERLRREFVLDGKVVERNPKVANERRRTKALLQSSHRRIMAKPEAHNRFVRIVPGKPEPKSKVNIDQLKKKCTPMTVDVEHLDIEVSEVKPDAKEVKGRPKKEQKSPDSSQTKLSRKDIEEIKSIIQEMTEDCQLLALDDKIGFFSWSKGVVRPKVVMYQVMQGDEFRVPWLYLPIPPQGYSWICHYLTSSFEKTDYVYIPEIKCCIPSQALRVNMNNAFVRKKPVVFDVKAEGNSSGVGKIYFFPDLPKVLVCGPFRTDQTTANPKDPASADQIAAALQHLERLRLMKRFGDDQSWKRFTKAPTIFPIRQRNDNETVLSAEESRALFAQIYPSLMEGATPDVQYGGTIKPMIQFDWASAVKFVGLTGAENEKISITELITLDP